MIISNLVENSDGSNDFDFKVDKREFLLSYAIKALMREGIIKAAIDEEYSQEVDLPLETQH